MRTGRESHAELDRLLEEAIRLLERTDLRGANEALKKASAEAASLREAGPTLESTGTSPSGARSRRGYRRGGRGEADPRQTPEERPMLGRQQEVAGQAREQERQTGER